MKINIGMVPMVACPPKEVTNPIDSNQTFIISPWSGAIITQERRLSNISFVLPAAVASCIPGMFIKNSRLLSSVAYLFRIPTRGRSIRSRIAGQGTPGIGLSLSYASR